MIGKKTMRLDRFLAQENFGTRKHVKKLIRSKAVQVGQVTIVDPAFSFDPKICEVQVGKEVVEYHEELYFLLNKPRDYLCSTLDELYPSVIRLLPLQHQKKLQIVGRLDVDTTGVLLLTNDGKFNNYLAHPKNMLGKTYAVRLNHEIPDKLIEAVKAPIDLGHGEFSSGAELEITAPERCLLTLHEGRYHEVKRIFRHFDLDVVELDRVRFANFTYSGLARGEYRALSPVEIEDIIKVVHPERYQD